MSRLSLRLPASTRAIARSVARDRGVSLRSVVEEWLKEIAAGRIPAEEEARLPKTGGHAQLSFAVPQDLLSAARRESRSRGISVAEALRRRAAAIKPHDVPYSQQLANAGFPELANDPAIVRFLEARPAGLDLLSSPTLRNAMVRALAKKPSPILRPRAVPNQRPGEFLLAWLQAWVETAPAPLRRVPSWLLDRIMKRIYWENPGEDLKDLAAMIVRRESDVNELTALFVLATRAPGSPNSEDDLDLILDVANRFAGALPGIARAVGYPLPNADVIRTTWTRAWVEILGNWIAELVTAVM